VLREILGSTRGGFAEKRSNDAVMGKTNIHVARRLEMGLPNLWSHDTSGGWGCHSPDDNGDGDDDDDDDDDDQAASTMPENIHRCIEPRGVWGRYLCRLVQRQAREGQEREGALGWFGGLSGSTNWSAWEMGGKVGRVFRWAGG
jgi:hypothetical protein